MIPKDGLTPQYLVAALRRRFWYVIVPFFIVFVTTVVYCIQAPKIYRSSALILVQPQEVPKDYVRTTVTSDVQSRLVTIIEQVMSRSRLEEIVKKYDLYPESRKAGNMYAAIDRMRKNIHVEFKKAWSRRGSPPAFEVAFEGRDPAKVRDVATALVNIFLDENLKIREAQAVGTSHFLKRELERLREQLRQKEESVRKFREKYMGILPDQVENNHRILTQLQQHLDSLNTALQRTEDRKILLQSQLSKLETLKASDHVIGPDGDEISVGFEELRTRLKNLRSRYTDQHPDVVRLAATIDKLEKENSGSAESEAQEQNVVAQATEIQQSKRVKEDELNAKLGLIDKEVQSLQKEKTETTRMIQEYRHRIESGPMIEQKFVDLRRDYEMATANYQSLLQKKMQSDLAENLERTQKGEQFRIQDPAIMPQKPFKPNIPKNLAIGLMLALASGIGLAFVREFLDQTFWATKDLESVLHLPVLVSVPLISTEKERRWKSLKKLGTACMLVSMFCVLVSVLLYLVTKDPTAFL